MAGYGQGSLQAWYDRAPLIVQNVMTSLYGWRLRRRSYGTWFQRYLAELAQSQYLPRETLLADQARRLQDFVQHAYTHSAYWRQVFDAARLRPADLRGPADLAALPLLEKQTVRERIDDIASDAYNARFNNVVPVHTSGTTGKALHLNLSRRVWEREYAFRQLHRAWGGIHQGDRIATFAGHPVVPTATMRPPFWRENWAEQQVIFSSQHITPHALPHYADKLIHFQPAMIHGYPSSLYLLALYLDREGIDSIRPRAVYTHSETLLEYQERLLARVFDCPIFNWYGNTEMAGNIVRCEAGSLHVKLEHSVLEFLRPDGQPAKAGEMAEIVCTAFGNYATPLLRYRVGDSAVPAAHTCACGRAGPLVDTLLGRVEDIIVTPEGRHVGRIDHAFKDMLNVSEAQLLQERIDTVRVRLVVRPAFGAADKALLEKELRLRLGPEIKIEYETVTQIPRAANGKFRFVISRVPLQIGAGVHQGAEP